MPKAEYGGGGPPNAPVPGLTNEFEGVAPNAELDEVLAPNADVWAGAAPNADVGADVEAPNAEVDPPPPPKAEVDEPNAEFGWLGGGNCAA